ncbi:MAG: LPS export ABC transporter ATP-binding protein, partial [Candidatus Dadabacteria bacterium]
MEENSRVLETNSLVKSYQGRKVVNGVSIYLRNGEVVGLLGPNGAGKTTTFYMCVGLVKPTSGDIYLNGARITEVPIFERAELGLAYLPQEPSIFRKLTVEENILAILETIPNLSKEEQEEKLETLLTQLGIKELRNSLGRSLSGGERRRVEIARALTRNPSFLLLDEPFAGIDPLAVRDLQNNIIKLKKDGIGILITDHNVRETLQVCDRAYILVDGKVLVSGTPAEIIESNLAKRYYLGEDY